MRPASPQMVRAVNLYSHLIHSLPSQLDRLPSRTASRNSFIGDESDAPPMPRVVSAQKSSSQTPSSLGGAATPDPSVWSQEQQEEFMRALMGAGVTAPGAAPQPNIFKGAPGPNASQPADMQDPLMALMSSFAAAQGGSNGPIPTTDANAPFNMPPGMPAFPGMNFPGAGAEPAAPPKPKSLVQKLLPLLHLLATFALLVYFVLWKEADAFSDRAGASVLTGADGKAESRWRRWAELGWRAPEDGGWGVQAIVCADSALASPCMLTDAS